MSNILFKKAITTRLCQRIISFLNLLLSRSVIETLCHSLDSLHNKAAMSTTECQLSPDVLFSTRIKYQYSD